MIQVNTFADVDEFNEFLAELSEDVIIKIEWKVIESEEGYTDYFMIQYRE
ncbi:hypothetical protein [Paenibacillus agricola]|uniref:Uncharacterized protein n=1 Tax=Paenibacillus agricola TaxID=2716264 RepID=A0ABX0JDU0_9BACL|nr:hypothetical protein [Paenibacillus agricola]NHN32878.1 hypothetical protein [Paenibacillus agricola]